MKKVSVIVPVYNVELYLRRCLDSLVNQTLNDIEVIVVNDGSPDHSQAIIDEYVSKYPDKVISIIKENGGQASARNLAIKKANGEYLGFVDSDDWVETNMFERLYETAKNENADLVSCDYKIYYENENKYEDRNLDIDISRINEELIIKQPAIWNKLVKKELFLDNNLFFPEGIIYEDYALTPLLIPLSKKNVHIKDCLYFYVVRGNSTMTQDKFNKKFYNIIDATKFLYSHVKSNNIYDKYFSEYEYAIICNLLRDNFLRLKHLSEAKYILDDSVDWIKQNIPNWQKNSYYKKNHGFKEKIYNKLIYMKKYKILGFGGK